MYFILFVLIPALLHTKQYTKFSVYLLYVLNCCMRLAFNTKTWKVFGQALAQHWVYSLEIIMIHAQTQKYVYIHTHFCSPLYYQQCVVSRCFDYVVFLLHELCVLASSSIPCSGLGHGEEKRYSQYIQTGLTTNNHTHTYILYLTIK